MPDQQAEQSASEKKKEDWMNAKWRPMMGWMYMVVCTMDMVIFPILWSTLQTVTHTPITQWNPLTLQGAGLFHIAMGAVLGIAAMGRTQEKLAGANNGGAPAPAPAGGFGAPAAAPSGFGTAGSAGGGFGAPASGPVSPAPSWGTTPVQTTVTQTFGGGFGSSTPVATTAGGKKIVPDADQPLL
jgi:hypothetical protein